MQIQNKKCMRKIFPQRKPKLVNMILIVGQWLLHVCVIFASPSSMSTIYIDHKCYVMSRHDVFNQVNILNIDSSDVQIDIPVFVYWE